MEKIEYQTRGKRLKNENDQPILTEITPKRRRRHGQKQEIEKEKIEETEEVDEIQDISRQENISIPPLVAFERDVSSHLFNQHGSFGKYVNIEDLRAVIDYMNTRVLFKDEAIRICLLAMIMGKNALLFGPPGTSKSLIVDSIAAVFVPEQGDLNRCKYFRSTFHSNTTIDEVFGPINIEKLRRRV
jgi:hypothetical protein